MRGRSRKGPNPLSRSFESNGPDVKIRGTASHVAEKYVTLARDAASSSDRVAEQRYLQHAEHYFRIVAAAQAQMPQPQRSDNDGEETDERSDQVGAADETKPDAELSDSQPYTNGGNAGTEPNGQDGGPVEATETETSENAGPNGGPRSAPRNRRPPRERSPRPRGEDHH